MNSAFSVPSPSGAKPLLEDPALAARLGELVDEEELEAGQAGVVLVDVGVADVDVARRPVLELGLDLVQVVLAAGSWSGLVEGAGVPSTVVRPARGQLVSIETRPPMFRHVVSVHGRGYLVPRRDGTRRYEREGLSSIADCLQDAAAALGSEFCFATIIYESMTIGSYPVAVMEHRALEVADELMVRCSNQRAYA